jgi:hypothetical protein
MVWLSEKDPNILCECLDTSGRVSKVNERTRKDAFSRSQRVKSSRAVDVNRNETRSIEEMNGVSPWTMYVERQPQKIDTGTSTLAPWKQARRSRIRVDEPRSRSRLIHKT